MEAARDLGASPWQTIRHVVLPIIAPSLIGVALFGFTLSYDEFARTLLTAGSYNTLPLEIYGIHQELYLRIRLYLSYWLSSLTQ